ncbi:hypothetical protein ACTFIW_002362 [Dictyostelium discoideum]
MNKDITIYSCLRNMIFGIICGLYVLSILIIYLYGIELQIEMPQEQREILKKLPLVGNLRVEKLTVNFIGFCILSLSSILLLVLRNGRKVKYFELLITVIGGIGYNINRQIIQEIKQYKDIIYENNWFLIRKIYTIGEKKAYMIQKIKEYCRTHQLPYKKEYETVISKKLEKVGIEEIPLLVKQELTNTLVTESSGFPYEYIAYAGIILALGGLGAYVGYSVFKDLMAIKGWYLDYLISELEKEIVASELPGYLDRHSSFGLYALRPMTRLPILPLPDGSVGFGYFGNYKIMAQVTEGADSRDNRDFYISNYGVWSMANKKIKKDRYERVLKEGKREVVKETPSVGFKE